MTITINHFKTRVVRYPLLALALICALIATGLRAGLDKAEWAYWVGAIGTITAVGVSVFLLNRQIAEQRAEVRGRNQQARTSKLLHSLMLLYQAHKFLNYFVMDAREGRFQQMNFEVNHARLNGVTTELRSFDYIGLREDEALCIAKLALEILSLTEITRIVKSVSAGAESAYTAHIEKATAQIAEGIAALRDSYCVVTGINPFPGEDFF